MPNLILFHFESAEIRFVGTADKPEWIAADICKVLGLSNPSESLKNFSSTQAGISSTDIRSEDGTVQSRQVSTVTESGLYRLIFKSRKPVAEKFQNWICDEVLPAIRKTGAYSIDSDREKLERQFQPTPSLKDIKGVSGVLKAAGFKQDYIERLAIANLKKHYPQLLAETPQSQDMASLATAKSLLTPTKIAEILGLTYKTSSGNGSKVNSLLAELGYQESIGGRWSATEKAIAVGLVDRKPVNTNSRTQKDQLLRSADIIPILQEHLVEA